MQTDIAPHAMTSNAYGKIVTSASTVYSTLAAWCAFDGALGTGGYWLGANAGVDWLKIDFGAGSKILLVGYSLSANTIPEATRMVKNWTFEGSLDDSTWAVLDTRVNEVSWGSGETRYFSLSSPPATAYRYFRINITANNGDASYTQIAEVYLWVREKFSYLIPRRDRLRTAGVSLG